MNRSGAVLPILFDRFGPDSRILVVCDDLALPLGRIRIRERGSAGGHNGLKSIGSAVGSGDYLRVRVGIDSGRMIEEARDYVLSEVAPSDRALLERSEELAADSVVFILTQGTRPTMSKYNGMDLRVSDA
jgi:PTH1 family peptidyl-tRNA hydrolase